mgnify:FL=1
MTNDDKKIVQHPRKAVTWDLPIDVIEAAKACASIEGMLLWRWITRALEHEIEASRRNL